MDFASEVLAEPRYSRIRLIECVALSIGTSSSWNQSRIAISVHVDEYVVGRHGQETPSVEFAILVADETLVCRIVDCHRVCEDERMVVVPVVADLARFLDIFQSPAKLKSALYHPCVPQRTLLGHLEPEEDHCDDGDCGG